MDPYHNKGSSANKIQTLNLLVMILLGFAWMDNVNIYLRDFSGYKISWLAHFFSYLHVLFPHMLIHSACWTLWYNNPEAQTLHLNRSLQRSEKSQSVHMGIYFYKICKSICFYKKIFQYKLRSPSIWLCSCLWWNIILLVWEPFCHIILCEYSYLKA